MEQDLICMGMGTELTQASGKKMQYFSLAGQLRAGKSISAVATHLQYISTMSGGGFSDDKIFAQFLHPSSPR